MSDDAAMYLAIGFIVIIIAMFALGLRRGRNVQATNEQIEANQKRQIEVQELQLKLNERQVIALEQIADALKRRG